MLVNWVLLFYLFLQCLLSFLQFKQKNFKVQIKHYTEIITLHPSIKIHMNIQPVRIPYLNEQRGNNVDKNYFDMIKNRFFPNFQLLSMSTFLILLNIVVFIIIHILYSPSKYDSFLQWPYDMDKWLLDIELIKSNKKYLYQIATSLFMHSSYLHLVGNIIFAVYIMYQLEYCWKPSILWGLLGGAAAQCLAIISLQGRYLGFSGVLCCYFGIFLGSIFTHCSYLQQRYRQQFWMVVVMVVFMAFMLIGFAASALVHLYGFTFGILLGIAVYPKVMGHQLNSSLDKIFKGIAFGSIILVFVLAALL